MSVGANKLQLYSITTGFFSESITTASHVEASCYNDCPSNQSWCQDKFDCTLYKTRIAYDITRNYWRPLLYARISQFNALMSFPFYHCIYIHGISLCLWKMYTRTRQNNALDLSSASLSWKSLVRKVVSRGNKWEKILNDRAEKCKR